jgi:catechol 2,3-dioxygenase-like lactoylglutathione lyase family enzyme
VREAYDPAVSLHGVSHLAIGVRDMDRSLAFYRDQLGMEVVSDREQEMPASEMYSAPESATSRRVAQLRWADDPDAPFLVLSAFPAASGTPLRLDQVGMHHAGLWVKDLAGMAERLRAAGVHFVKEPSAADARGYRGREGERVLTCLFEDPDGTILQFDERL